MALVRSYNMENISEFEVTNTIGDVLIYILIDRGNGEFTSMLKSEWDEQQAKQTEGGLN